MKHENLNFHNTVPSVNPSCKKKKLSPIIKNTKVPNFYFQKRDQNEIFKKVRPSPVQGILKLLVWSELGTSGNFMKCLSFRFFKICQCCKLNLQKSCFWSFLWTCVINKDSESITTSFRQFYKILRAFM